MTRAQEMRTRIKQIDKQYMELKKERDIYRAALQLIIITYSLPEIKEIAKNAVCPPQDDTKD